MLSLAPLLQGNTWQKKVSDIRSQMQKHPKAPTAVLLSALDETACECGLMDTGGRLGPPKPQASWTCNPELLPQSPYHHGF